MSDTLVIIDNQNGNVINGAVVGRDFIIVNGVSSDTVGLYIDTPPMPPMQASDFQTITIPNRAEALTIQAKTRPDVQIDINAYLFDDEQSADPADIYAYLNNATTLKTSKNDNFEYRVRRLLGVVPAYQGHGKQLLTISFICSPYRYSTNNDPVEYTQPAVTITNHGSEYSQPIWKLYGTGELTLTVNEDDENALVIPDVDGYVIADAEKLICHKDGTIVRCAGKIPFLNVGDNYIQTNATKIEVTKNERWL